MLTLEPPFYEISGILVYRDHAVPTQYYYAAPPPTIARSAGRLMFDVLGYSVDLKHSVLSGTAIPDQLGAGFLTMGTECVLTDSQRSAITREVSQHAGLPEEQITLYPISYHQGTVSILALDQYSSPATGTGTDGSTSTSTSTTSTASTSASSPPPSVQGRPTFVEQIIGSGKPSLLGNLQTIFSLSLSQDGLTFMEKLYEQHAAPVGVVYDLRFYGLRPAVDARITADLTRVYRHFGGGVGLQYSWIKADIQAGLDQLREEGAIKIEITSQAVGDAAQHATDLAMSLFRDQIVQQMFRPTSPPPTVPPVSTSAARGTSAKQGFFSIRADFKLTEESKSVVYEFSQRAPEERTHSPQGFLPALLSPAELASHVHLIDLHNPFFELLDVLVTGPTKDDFAALGIRQIEATLTYGQSGDAVPPESQTLLFRPDSTGDKTFAVKRQGRTSLEYQAALTYEFARTGNTASDSFRYDLPPVAHTGRSLLINPYADFGVLDVDVEPGRIHPDVKQVDVDLRYASADGAFTAQDHVRLIPGASPETRGHWQVRTREVASPSYSATYTFTFQDGSTYAAKSLVSTEPFLQVDTPFGRDRELLIRPNPISADINEITVELDYHDDPNGYHRQFLVNLTPPFAAVRQTWPVIDPNAQKVRYRVTVQEPGMSSEGDWEETGDPSIVVGSVAHRVGKVQIQLIGPSLADVGLDALQVKVTLAQDGSSTEGPQEEPQSVLLQPGQTSASVDLVIPPGTALHYQWQTTSFKSTGVTVESDWKDGTSSTLIISTRTLTS